MFEDVVYLQQVFNDDLVATSAQHRCTCPDGTRPYRVLTLSPLMKLTHLVAIASAHETISKNSKLNVCEITGSYLSIRFMIGLID